MVVVADLAALRFEIALICAALAVLALWGYFRSRA